jgi:hypothetical protein
MFLVLLWQTLPSAIRRRNLATRILLGGSHGLEQFWNSEKKFKGLEKVWNSVIFLISQEKS